MHKTSRSTRTALAALAALVPMLASADDIRLLTSAHVIGPTVELREIALLEGEYAQSLADTVIRPAQQAPHDPITLEQVRDALTQHGVNWAKLSLKGFPRCNITVEPPQPQTQPQTLAHPRPVTPEVTVSISDASPILTDLTTPITATQPLTVRGLVADEIARLTGLPDDQLVVTFRAQDEDLLNQSTIATAYTVQPTGNALLGNVPIRIERSNLAGKETFTVLAKVQRKARAVVATRPLSRGQRIGSDDVTLRDVLIDRDDQPWLDQTSAVLGATARSNVSIGQVVSIQDLSTPPIVQRGQLVTLRVLSGAVSVEGQGFAEQAGTLGDTVRVRRGNDRQGPVVLGTVVAPGRVDVLVRRPVSETQQ